MLHRLDPHSTYIPAQEGKCQRREMQGFEGIGIEFQLYKDTMTIARIIENGPRRAGWVMAVTGSMGSRTASGSWPVRIRTRSWAGSKASRKTVSLQFRRAEDGQMEAGDQGG